MKELFWFLIIIIFCFCLIMVFLYILIFLYKRFGIIGLKEKDFKKSHIFSDENNKPSNYLDIYNYYYYNLSRNRFDISMIFSMNEVYKKIIQNTWYEKTNKTLNLNNPLTFNEKMQWLKLYNSIPIKTILADKYLVREYIKNKIGAQYLIPLLGVYSKFEDINFAQLPNQFVIKCNHGSGFNIIVKDKSNLNMEIIKKQLDEWMGYNYGLSFKMELHYRDIQPKIIIEKYMDDGTGDLRDYKITCFNGKPEFLWIDINRHSEHKRNLYDLKGNQLPYEFNTKYKSIPLSEKPKQLRQLLKLASILSKNFLFARIDFYLVDQRIYHNRVYNNSILK